jgi:glycosyltransferase involved in cell wall biosynthesis
LAERGSTFPDLIATAAIVEPCLSPLHGSDLQVTNQKRPVRVGFINTHPIQYFAPLYAYLNRADGLSITAFYLSDYSIRGARDGAFGQVVKWDIDLLAGYDVRFVAGAASRNEAHGFFSVIAPRLWRDVQASGLDALVVHGHTPAAMLVAIAAAKASNIPVFMRCETHLGLHRSALRLRFRKPLLKLLYGGLNGFLAIGTANAEFYRTIGVQEHRIFPMPYAVDNARFMAASQATVEDRPNFRASLGVRDARPIILFAGKLQRRKRPDDLLRAAAILARDGLLFHVVMVGSGDMEPALRAMSRQLGIASVHFAGFVNQSQLPEVYAACDIFVLPAENEPWGLAVNEAMAAGLPIVASAELGCVPDLLRHDRNGRTFIAGDIQGLANALRPLLSDREKRLSMGAQSREIISRWSYAECLRGLRQAVASLGVGLPITTLEAEHRS